MENEHEKVNDFTSHLINVHTNDVVIIDVPFVSSNVSDLTTTNWTDMTSTLSDLCDSQKCTLPSVKGRPDSGKRYWLICYSCLKDNSSRDSSQTGDFPINHFQF